MCRPCSCPGALFLPGGKAVGESFRAFPIALVAFLATSDVVRALIAVCAGRRAQGRRVFALHSFYFDIYIEPSAILSTGFLSRAA